MIKLFTEEEFNNSIVSDKLPCKCYECNAVFYKTKRAINDAINNRRGHNGKYCSDTCLGKSRITSLGVNCKNCNKEFTKLLNQTKRSPNHFCSRSCAATYNQAHKTKGTRVSKLEIWLQKQITINYPDLEIHYNRKDAINSELDIYIPSLKLAFELNGIFHYEPIYGQDKLNQIQNNDNRKFQACLERKIEFVIIDTSSQKYFKEKTAIKFLNIILTLVNEHLKSE